jgi:hypothetical protein
MLSRAFLTARKLHLRKAEYEALISLLHMMERGEIVHAPMSVTEYGCPKPDKYTGLFNMRAYWAQASENPECGTIACIAGASDLLFGTHFVDDYKRRTSELHDLFAPHEIEIARYYDITVAQATQALSNYLTTGDACWYEVLHAA